MSPRRRVLLGALSSTLLVVAALAVPAYAQFYDVARASYGFTMDPLERSPRLLGMGRLNYVGDDPHMALTLWDFAGNPLGILEADSANTVEIYPSTSSYSGERDLLYRGETYERQVSAARELRLPFEAWRRSGQAAYGAYGNVGMLRTDGVTGEFDELRSAYARPSITPVLMGRLPYVKSKRWFGSVRFTYAGESDESQYREMTWNAKGEYVDQSGYKLSDPVDYTTRTLGGGVGVGFDGGPALKVGVTWDYTSNVLKQKAEGAKHLWQVDEKRPYYDWQETLVGRVGPELEWGLDLRQWHSRSQQDWIFSVSTGTGTEGINGQGKLLDREETGQSTRSRLRWKRGPFEVGGGLTTGFSRLTISPPALDDPTSFNNWQNVTQNQPNAYLVPVTDSVTYNRAEEHTWEAGGGVAVKLPGNRGSWGFEYHQQHGVLEQTASGEGPLWKGWDFRTGFEYQCVPGLAGRVGYVYQWGDQDDYTKANEYLSHTMTLGLGLRPKGSLWQLEAGYSVEWLQADYGSPVLPRASCQQLAMMLRWAF